MENKPISLRPNNIKGRFHGYQEWYGILDDLLWIRGVWKDGQEIGYEENHNDEETIFYIR